MADRIGGGMQQLQPLRFTIHEYGATPQTMSPGSVPGLSVPPGTFDMPTASATPAALQAKGPTLTLDALTRDLGLDRGEESSLKLAIAPLLHADNEAILRQALFQYVRQHGYDGPLRAIVLERALSLYRNAGKAAGNAKRIRDRARGLTPTDTPMGVDMQKAQGPFIGPRGGKWADAKHTIAWDEEAHYRNGGERNQPGWVEVQTQDGPVHKEVLHHAGDFAAHKPVGDGGKADQGWSITHIPSGLSITRVSNKEQAKQAVEHFNAHVGDAASTKEQTPEARAKMAGALTLWGRKQDPNSPKSDDIAAREKLTPEQTEKFKHLYDKEGHHEQSALDAAIGPVKIGTTASGKDIHEAKHLPDMSKVPYDRQGTYHRMSGEMAQHHNPGFTAQDHKEAYRALKQAAGLPHEEQFKRLHAQAEAHSSAHERMTGKRADLAIHEERQAAERAQDEADTAKFKEDMNGLEIGTTQSGKPIMGNFDHPAHQGFTEQDHADAAAAHRRMRALTAGSLSNSREDARMRNHHEAQGKAHETTGSTMRIADANAKIAAAPAAMKEERKKRKAAAKMNEGAKPAEDTKKVTVATSFGPQELKAHHTIGDFSVHAPSGEQDKKKPSEYTVTHRPTGMRVGSAKTKAEAIEHAQHFHAHVGDSTHGMEFGKTPGKEHAEGMTKLREAAKTLKKSEDVPEDNLEKAITSQEGANALTIVLGQLQAFRECYQQLHWQAQGPNAYADHLLFSRLYDAVAAEIDATAEKYVGQALTQFPTAAIRAGLTAALIAELKCTPEGMLEQEQTFATQVIPEAKARLLKNGELSEGLENFLQGIADQHEEHVYLLKQRTTATIPTDATMTKAEPRGGKYHARLTDRESGKHRYFYTEQSFQKHAPVMGGDVARQRLQTEVLNAVKEQGTPIADLTALTGRYGAKPVTDMVRELVGSGKLQHSDGKLYRAVPRIEERPEVFRPSLAGKNEAQPAQGAN